MARRNERKMTIVVDWDGVIHSYISGWQGADVIPDPPVPGAIEWLRGLIQDEGFGVVISSARSSQPGGISAMVRYLFDRGFSQGEVSKIEFPTEKPSGWLNIDDRAICFRGTFPSPLEIVNFRPWNEHLKKR